VLQVGKGTVNYYVDGVLHASHGGDYYLEAPMSINFKPVVHRRRSACHQRAAELRRGR